MSKSLTLGDRVTDALDAIEAIRVEASTKDRELVDALEAKRLAEEQAEKSRRERDEAVNSMEGLRAQIIETKAAVAGEVATLKAEKELLAQRDRDSRNEIERLRLSKPFRQAASNGDLP